MAQPLAQVRLEPLVGLARQAGELLLGLADRPARRVALAGGGRVAGLAHERGDLVGLGLRDQRRVIRAAAGEHERAQPGREERGTERHRPYEASASARASRPT